MSTLSPYQILVEPVITEKAMSITSEQHPVYTFRVSLNANKRQIKWAVEAAYGVKVRTVNTIRIKGKRRYSRNRSVAPGKRPDYKKAIVSLYEGQQIELV